jgi:phosphoglycerate kinase
MPVTKIKAGQLQRRGGHKAALGNARRGAGAARRQRSGVTVASLKKRDVESLNDEEVSHKVVLERADLNVPQADDGSVTDDTRIREAVPTIKYLLDRNAKVVLTTHLGRPKGQGVEEKYKLDPVASKLSEHLGFEVKKLDDCINVKEQIDQAPFGSIILLENVRFYKEETDNDYDFAKKLAEPADMFVHDAFGTAHRAHASTEGVTKHVSPNVSGYLLQKEIDYLNNAVANPTRPFASIIGGSKVSGKIGVIEALLQRCDKLFLGGGMIFTFFKAKGFDVGGSLIEEDKIDLAKDLISKAEQKGVQLYLPTDVVVADVFDSNANSQTVQPDSIPEDWMGLDIGPETLKQYQKELEQCKTIVWNGPMGVFEFDKFAEGTYGVAQALANLQGQADTIIGGGDSVAAVEESGLAGKMSHISTGGGASLELLEGRELPGLLVRALRL